MLSRRVFVAGLGALPWTMPAVAAEAVDPAGVLAEVYKRIAQTKKRKVNDFWQSADGRPSAFSADLVALWAKAEAKVEPGDQGPVDFDLFSNSQDSGPTAPMLTTVDDDGTTAHVRATLKAPKPGKEPSADDVLVFTLKRETAGWRIDDIHGSVSGDGWSLRGILALP